MAEQRSIFSEIEDARILATKKRLRKKILTGQVIALILSIFLLLVGVFTADAGSFIPLIIIGVATLMAILAFKWPFPCLLILSVLYSILIVVSSFNTFMQPNSFRENSPGYFFGEIIGFLIFISLPYFMIRGTVAAKKYNSLSKS